MYAMESTTLVGIWACSTGFHTDGLAYDGYEPAAQAPTAVRDPETGQRKMGGLGAMHRYRCEIHNEFVHFAAGSR